MQLLRGKAKVSHTDKARYICTVRGTVHMYGEHALLISNREDLRAARDENCPNAPAECG